MAERYLGLPAAEQREILAGLATEFGRAAAVLEKDIWVCWVLQQLFQMPHRLPMAFKGGTSLSKVFAAIQRFSEDIDITLDYRGFDTNVDPFDSKTSRTQIRKLNDALRAFVREHAHDVVVPYLTRRLHTETAGGASSIEVSEDGEAVRVYYPSALDRSPGYLRDSVLIEFGGRNITEPNAEHTIQPDIAARLPTLELPSAEVTVLSPLRTFWEKATLIHVECHRPQLKASADRQSRHWSDLARLADHDIGRRALADRVLLADVVKHKTVFFNVAYANYGDCLAGNLRLVPDDALLAAIATDLAAMIDGGMFYGETPSFDRMIERLRALEQEINANA